MPHSQLRDVVRQRKLILFVGAGISMNVGAPSWSQLIEQLASDLGYDPDIFATYGDNLALAEYYVLQKGSIGELRSWMDTAWHRTAEDLAKSEVHQALVKLDCPIIYTTNYDKYLELAHEAAKKKFTRISNVSDFNRIEEGVTQIIKFHGDFSDDKSLVLSESSYFDRLTFEAPLDIKLRSDCIGKSILFVGYSLSDPNIRFILFKLQRLWEASGYGSSRPPCFIYLGRPNPVQEHIFRSRGIIPLIAETDDPGTELLNFLRGLID